MNFGELKQQMKIAIKPNGELEMIYSDEFLGILSEGTSSIQRASHVEPAVDNTWTADMSPVGGGCLSGFTTRQEALNAEVDWLNTQYLSV